MAVDWHGTGDGLRSVQLPCVNLASLRAIMRDTINQI